MASILKEQVQRTARIKALETESLRDKLESYNGQHPPTVQEPVE